MDKCQRQRLTLLSLRGLLSACVGLVTGFGAYMVAKHFGVELPGGTEVLSGCAAGAITWFAARSKFQFTEECMHMALGAELRQDRPVQLGKARPVRTMVAPNTTKPATSAPAVLNNGPLFSRGRLQVSVETGEDAIKVLVVRTKGLSGSEFKGNNGLRPRLEAVAGVKWENPKNEQNGNRTMTGKLVKGANESEIAAKIVSICERFV